MAGLRLVGSVRHGGALRPPAEGLSSACGRRGAGLRGALSL